MTGLPGRERRLTISLAVWIHECNRRTDGWTLADSNYHAYTASCDNQLLLRHGKGIVGISTSFQNKGPYGCIGISANWHRFHIHCITILFQNLRPHQPSACDISILARQQLCTLVHQWCVDLAQYSSLLMDRCTDLDPILIRCRILGLSCCHLPGRLIRSLLQSTGVQPVLSKINYCCKRSDVHLQDLTANGLFIERVSVVTQQLFVCCCNMVLTLTPAMTSTRLRCTSRANVQISLCCGV